jgi:hypothetical protein
MRSRVEVPENHPQDATVIMPTNTHHNTGGMTATSGEAPHREVSSHVTGPLDEHDEDDVVGEAANKRLFAVVSAPIAQDVPMHRRKSQRRMPPVFASTVRERPHGKATKNLRMTMRQTAGIRAATSVARVVPAWNFGMLEMKATAKILTHQA